MTDECTIYYHPNCSKCFSARAILKELEVPHTAINYLEAPPSATELQRIIESAEIEPMAFVRVQDKDFSLIEGFVKTREIASIARTLHQYPQFLQRPVVVYRGKAIIGRPTDKIEELFST